MRLSNNFLLSAVWSAAVTSLVMLLAAIANAGTMHADVLIRDQWAGIDPDANPWVKHGDFDATFDPASQSQPSEVRFLIEVSNNRGVYAWDDTPEGWIDVQAVQWDLTVDGISCECFGGGDDPDRLQPQFITDGIRLVNTADESYIEYSKVFDGQVMTVRESAASAGLEWRNTTVTIPEPSAVVLLLVGVMLCVGGRTK